MIFRFFGTVKLLLAVAFILLGRTALAAPANDSFAERIQLVGTNVNFTVTLAGAEADTGGYGGVWWEWMAISNGIVTIDPTLPVALDAWMTISRASSPVTMPTGADQVYFGELFRSVSFVAKAGEIYLIAVRGLAYQQQTAQFELALRFSPANDHFDDRFILPSNIDEFSGSAYGASYEYAGGVYASFGSVWWKWTPNVSGFAAIRHVTANRGYDELTIWPARSWEEITYENEIARTMPLGSIYFPITANQEYAIRLAGNNRTNFTHRFAVTMISGPGFLTQPQDQTVAPGGATIFHVYTPGIPSTNVTWELNGVEIPGAYGPAYPVANANATNVGAYRAVAKIGGVATYSQQASLSLTADVPMPMRVWRKPEDPEAILFGIEGNFGMYHVLESSSDLVNWEPVNNQHLPGWPNGPWLVSTSLVVMEAYPLRYLPEAGATAPSYRGFFRARRAGIFKNACTMNLRRIYLAKEDYRIQHQLGPGFLLPADGVNQYFSESLLPRCPEGGTYTYNAGGTPPTCTLLGHTL
jgi:hypothetical protein